MYSTLYAQADDVFVSYAPPDPAVGQVLAMQSAPLPSVVGVGGIVAAGAVNITRVGLLHRVNVDGNALAASGVSCVCGTNGCNCTAPAPCQGSTCSVGPSALVPGTTYKVGATTGPVPAGTVTTAADTTAPRLASSTVVAPGSITPGGFQLSGLQLDTSGLAYVMVAKPLTVTAGFLDPASEVLAVPVRCVVLANVQASPSAVVVSGLDNDTTYTVRVIAEDTSGNRRAYSSALRTVDLRPPSIMAVDVRPSFRNVNLSVTLSEPGSVVGFLYTAANAGNFTLATPTTWPPIAQDDQLA
ncbi:hypothetical protein GPECTOR_3g435 [Gonium pectorale]|uniref:Fibronectin type-III domain-containing protein n=1 Tax=Gonium pectorale TaxID=33097 RepID=A0A150H155_GONPE|nr:hypothetical protein GPECTOR_3g435 [Gonium pectorale]|eukprot:KXZ55300.1 hypothetical protein GPECTOR_3g435 [Gonium pectorale]